MNGVSPLLWLWAPLAAAAVVLSAEWGMSRDALAYFYAENGPCELLQFVVVFVAFLAAVRLLARMDRKADPWLFAWIAIAALGSFYIAGEEVSWGQQFLHWSTPADWAAINDQDETNLHNTSSWLDQKPRWLLQAGMVAGGLLVPAIRRVRPGLLPARFGMIYPSGGIAVTAGAALVLKLAETVCRAVSGGTLFYRSSEVMEFYMFYFVLLYLLDFKVRLAARGSLVSPQQER